MKIGEILKFVRSAKGLSLRQLGDEIDVTFSTLGRIERGEVCDPDATARVMLWLMTPEKKVA